MATMAGIVIAKAIMYQMKFRSLFILSIVAALAIGCKSGDTTASTSPDSTKPSADATTPDSTKSADSSTADTSSANSVVGTWTNDNKGMKDGVIEFKDDGTMSINGTVAETGWTTDIEGTYKLEGDKITLHTTGQKFTAPEGADAAAKKAVDDANKQSEDAIAKMPADTASVKFTDKDTFVMTGSNGTPVTFKRKE